MANIDPNTNPEGLIAIIRNSVYGNQQVEKLDSVDAAIERTRTRIVSKNARNQAELVRDSIADTLSKEDFDAAVMPLGSDIDLLGRLTRYVNADDIVDNIPYCAKALMVLTHAIISPDDINKEVIQVLPKKQDTETRKRQVETLKNVINKLNIESTMLDVVQDTLKYGDQFVEVCNYKSPDVPLTQSLLNEGMEEQDRVDTLALSRKEYEIGIEQPFLNENTNKMDIDKRTINLDFELVVENDADELLKDLELDSSDSTAKDGAVNNSTKVEVSDVRIILHNPKNVVKIQSKRHKFCLGYLVLPEFDSSFGSYYGGGGSAGGGSSMRNSSIGLSSLMGTTSMFTGMDGLYRDLLGTIKKYLGNDDIYIHKKETLSLLKRTVGEIDPVDMDQRERGQVPYKVRFVPNNRMEHFYISAQRFFPYGEGIFFKSTFQAKLLIALETAVTIRRITDSTDKRIIYVEAGLPRDAKNIIEDLKMGFKKRKFSLDTLGNISSIPSMITSYEDIYIPQSKGRRFVEFDTLQSNVQIREVVDELKYFRDMIIASLSVPPVYLSVEENLSSRNALAFENAIFAQTVIAYQFMFSKQMKGMMSKILKILGKGSIDDSIIVTFPAPKMLQMERDAEKYDMLARIVQALGDMGVDKKWAVEQYVDLPWKDIENVAGDSQFDKKLEPDPMAAMGGGMMGMGGGGMPPAGGMY